MSCLCVAPLPLRNNCRATAWRMIVFTSAPAGLFVERAHFTGEFVVLQRYFEITSHQDILPLKKTEKKNLLLSIWPLTPTRASGLLSSPFDCTCALVETIFPLGVSHSLSERPC